MDETIQLPPVTVPMPSVAMPSASQCRRRASLRRRPRDRTAAGPGGRPTVRAPTKSLVAVPALLALLVTGTFVAGLSAEPFWLAFGHGHSGTATVVEGPARCRATFVAADGSFSTSTVDLVNTDTSGCVVGSTCRRAWSRPARPAPSPPTRSGCGLRWLVGAGLLLLLGLLIAWSTGASGSGAGVGLAAVGASVAAPWMIAAAHRCWATASCAPTPPNRTRPDRRTDEEGDATTDGDAPRRRRPRAAGAPCRRATRRDRLLARAAVGLGRGHQPGQVGRRRAAGRAGAPATTRVISPRTASAAAHSRARPACRGGSPRTSWSAPGRPRPHGRARTRPQLDQRLGEPVRRLEKHQCALLVRQPGQPGPPLAGFAGQEALEAEPVARQPRHRQRGGDAPTARGRRSPRTPGVERRPDQPEPGVGHAGHAAVGDQRDPGPVAGGLNQFGRPPVLVALEVGHDPPGS